jgi:tRNA pseudouridine55 synthase
VAEIAFGAASDTQDAQGRVTQSSDCYPSIDAVRAVLPRFTGSILQTPPSYSAIKQDGQRLYNLARKGEMVLAQPRLILVEELSVTCETENHGMMILVRCGKGTYVRTLCHDIGQAVSCPAHMRFLLRTQSGAFTLDEALTLEELKTAKDEARLQDCLLPMDMPLEHLKRLDVPLHLETLCRNGGKMPLLEFDDPAGLAEDVPLRLYLNRVFMGIGVRRGPFIAFKAMVG